MSEELPEFKQATQVFYKSRTGETKELRVVQPMEPGQKVFTLADLQILAKEIAKVLKEDAA